MSHPLCQLGLTSHIHPLHFLSPISPTAAWRLNPTSVSLFRVSVCVTPLSFSLQILKKEEAIPWPGTLAIVHSYIAYKEGDSRIFSFLSNVPAVQRRTEGLRFCPVLSFSERRGEAEADEVEFRAEDGARTAGAAGQTAQ